MAVSSSDSTYKSFRPSLYTNNIIQPNDIPTTSTKTQFSYDTKTLQNPLDQRCFLQQLRLRTHHRHRRRHRKSHPTNANMTAPVSLLDIDVDELFEQHGVADIDQIHKKLQTDVEHKKEELRTMVG